MGPSTDPCGTPYKTVDTDDLVAANRTCCTRPCRYERNQFKARPRRPYEACIRRMRVSWSTVSNAADKSRSARAVKSPRSSARRMSDSTLKTAVSVEWLRRYADCIVGIKPDSSRYASSLMVDAQASSILPTDLKWVGKNRLQQHPSGVMNADLNEAGTTPSDRDRLNKYVRNGASSSAHFFNKLVGKMSVEHCLSGNLRMIAITSSTVTGLNFDSMQPVRTGRNDGMAAWDVAARIASTLQSKNSCRVDASISPVAGASRRPRRALNDDHRARGRSLNVPHCAPWYACRWAVLTDDRWFRF